MTLTVEAQLRNLGLRSEIFQAVLPVLSLMKINGIFEDDPNYDGGVAAHSSSEYCIWAVNEGFFFHSRAHRIEVRLTREEFYIAFYIDHAMLLTLKYTEGTWFAYGLENGESEEFIASVKNAHEITRAANLDPVSVICSETDPASTVVLGILSSILSQAR